MLALIVEVKDLLPGLRPKQRDEKNCFPESSQEILEMRVHLCPHQGASEVCSDPRGACSAPVIAPCLHPAYAVHSKIVVGKTEPSQKRGVGEKEQN